MSLFLTANRSLFTGQVVDSQKPLYVASLVTNISVSNVPLIFVSRADLPQATPATLDSINLLLNGLITSALENYIDPLIDKNYSLIDRDDINYINLVNVLIDATDEHEAIEIIIAGIKAARLVARTDDTNIELLVKTNELEQFIANELYNIRSQTVMCASEEHGGEISMQKTFFLAPLYKYYNIIYGIPQNGQGYDTKKLGQVLIYLENNGIHPYKREVTPINPTPGNEPFVVNGYYPLYSSLDNIPGQSGESIEIGGVEYFMALGVDRFFGNFDEHEIFRIDDTFDGLKKDWLNDTSEGEVDCAPSNESEVDLTYSFGNL